MLEFEIFYDDRSLRKYLTDLELSQIPFATSKAMNLTMNDVQKAIREEEYPGVFTERNKSLAKALTTIPSKHRATKKNLRVSIMAVRDNRTGRIAGEGFVKRQIKNQVKKPKNSHIAIPVTGPGLRRLKTGSISKAKKPRGNKKLFRRGDALFERQKKGIRLRYILAKRARASRKGKFDYYGTAQRVTKRRLMVHWKREMVAAVAATAARNSRRLSQPTNLMRQ